MCVKKWLFPLAIAANIALLAVCLLYRMGGPAIYSLFVFLHILLFLLNFKAGKSWWQIILLGVIHILATYCAHRQEAWLYFHYVADDAEGRAIAWLACTIGTSWTIILLIASLVLFGVRQRNTPCH